MAIRIRLFRSFFFSASTAGVGATAAIACGILGEGATWIVVEAG